jgi:hypothetical protein
MIQAKEGSTATLAVVEHDHSDAKDGKQRRKSVQEQNTVPRILANDPTLTVVNPEYVMPLAPRSSVVSERFVVRSSARSLVPRSPMPLPDRSSVITVVFLLVFSAWMSSRMPEKPSWWLVPLKVRSTTVGSLARNGTADANVPRTGT